jgi:hypothetical protein
MSLPEPSENGKYCPVMPWAEFYASNARRVLGYDPPPPPPHVYETPAERRHRKQGERLARLVKGHAEQLGLALAAVLRPEMEEAARRVLAADLADALDVLRPLPNGGGR